MLNYKEILKNEDIIKEYEKIDKINPFVFNHGLKHVSNVCKIMERLCDKLNIDNDMKEALLIACALHDVGQADGRENHGLKARKIAERLFADELKDNNYENDILESIEKHDDYILSDRPLFTILVQFADKMDFTKNRLIDNYKEKADNCVYEKISNIEYIHTSDKFGINIITTEDKNMMLKFFDRSFSAKVINAVKGLSAKLNLDPIIQINGTNIPLSNYIILHGSFGSPDGNWFPWLKSNLQKNNNKVDVPQMPVGVGNQTYENWEKEFKKLRIDKDTIIIAHSIAPAFVCKFLIKNNIKVKKLIFVCGFNNYLGINEEYDTVNKPMFTDNIEEIKNNCDDIVCYYSNNDPYVKFEVEEDFADKISNRKYIIKNAGHINAESGYTEFKEILNEL